MIRFLTLLLGLLLLQGCTSSMVVKRVKADQRDTRAGIVYQLPFSQFDVTVTRVVTACGNTTVQFATTVDVSAARATPDPSQTFTIDNNSLNGIFRVGEVKAEYAKNGTVKSFNASADDRTAQVISAVVGGALKLGSLSGLRIAAAPDPGKAATQSAPVDACKPEVSGALAALGTATAAVSQASAEATLAADRYLALQTKVVALGGVVDEPTRRDLVAARDRADTAASVLALRKRALDKLKAALTQVQVFSWPPNGSVFDEVMPAPPYVVTNWTHDQVQITSPVDAVRLVLAGRGAAGAHRVAVDDQADPLGLPYRVAAQGRLAACLNACGAGEPLAIVDSPVLQLGTVYFLPCQSQTFGSTSCSMTSDDAGVLVSVGTANKTSAAETLANLGKGVAEQYVAAREARRSAQQKAYEAETARLKAQADYEKAVAAQTPDATQGIKDATAVYKAYADYYAAQKAMDDARAAAPVAPVLP